jgi:glycosyltransferase involved in cell wall biosynthesis
MTYTPGITVVIPSIPPRGKLLQRAMASVALQTVPACAVAVAYDDQHLGAGPTRTRALRMAQTEWVAFLDDDDALLPNHLELLLAAAKETEADVLWPWFKVVGGTDPFPGHRGKQLNPDDPHIFPITTLVRNEYAQQGEFPGSDVTGEWIADDWPFWRQMQELGATFHHIPDVTWHWFHHGWGMPGTSGNTSGRPDRW